MSRKLNHSLAIGILQIGILFSSISEGFSQTSNYTWNNSTNLWSTTTAWDPTGGPQSSSSTTNTNVAIFASVGASNNTVLLGSDRTAYGLIFTNGANAYTFGSVSTAKQLDIMSGIGLQNVSGQNQIFSLSVANNGTGLWTNSAGSTTTFNNGLNLTTSGSSSSRTLTLGGAGTWNVASAIANGGTATAGKVTVTATGTTTLSGNNTYGGATTMNALGGALTLSGNNSGAAGGVTLTAGTLNINNNNALGTGAISFAGTNSAGVGPRINNTSGSAVVNAGNQGWTWSDGLAFGAPTSTAANDLNLGTGVVTVAGSRTIALEGTGTKLTIGAANITSTSSGRTITANGAGNTLEMGGLTLSGNTTAAVTVTLAGTANLGVTGAIVNGQAFANGVTTTNTGTTTFSGNNTYTGVTTISAGTTILSGNNSDATGGLVLGGASGTLDKPLVKLNSVNAISSSSTISGSSSSDRVGTLDFNAGTAYTLNSYSGGTINFTNSFGQDSVVTFTNAASTLTFSAGSTGGRSLQNNSANLDIVFNGSLDIGSSSTDTVNTIGGAGDFVVKGNIFSTTAGSVRGLSKTGSGLLEMRGDNNNYNGNTTIFNGTISVTNGAVLTGTTVRVAPSSGNSGTLIVNGTAGAVVVSARGIVRGGGPITSLQVQDAGTVEVAVGTTWTTGGTIDFTAGSKVSVTGTPTAGNTYTLLKASSDITGSIPTLEGVTDWLLAVEGTELKLKQIQVADGFSQYLVAQSLLPGTAFDAVVNGSKVGLQYAFGSSTGMPLNNGVTAFPVMSGNQLTYTFDVKDDSALTVTYQTSTDLVTWTAAQAVSVGVGSSTTGFLKKQVQVTGSGKLFIRINVTR